MPRKRLPWIKLWFEIIGDPKMTRLSSAEKWYWIGILLLAGQSPIRGKLMLTSTEPMSADDISAALSLSAEEIPQLKNCIAKLQKLGSLALNSNCFEVVHFKERQEVYESDFEDYHKAKADKLLINAEITPEKVLKEEEGRRKKKDITPLSKDKGVHKKRADPTVNEIFSEMKRFLGYPENKVCGGEALPAIEENQAMTADRRDPIPNYGKEGKAIKRMLTRGFTREEILACWRSKVSQRGGEFVSMVWVNDDIGKKGVAGGADKRHTEPPKLENWANKPLRPATGSLGDWSSDKPLR